MQVGMRQFSAETVTRVIEESSKPSVTRGELARLLCELDHWYDSKGRPAVSSARKALVKLAHKAGFELPQACAGNGIRFEKFRTRRRLSFASH